MSNNKKTRVELVTLAPFLFKRISDYDTKDVPGQQTITSAIDTWNNMLQKRKANGKKPPSKIFLSIPLIANQSSKSSTNSKQCNSAAKRAYDGELGETSLSDGAAGETTPEPSRKKAKTIKDTEQIASIVDLIQFCGNLELDPQQKGTLDTLVEKVSLKNLNDVIKSDSKDLNCKKVLKLYEEYSNNHPATTKGIPTEEDIDIDATKQGVEASLKQLRRAHPGSKIKVLNNLTVTNVAKMMCYYDVYPATANAEFARKIDDFIAFQVTDMTTLRSFAYPYDSITKKRTNVVQGNYADWMVELKEKLIVWEKDGGWSCNLKVIGRRPVFAVLLYKHETYMDIFPSKPLFPETNNDLYDSNSDDSSSDDN